MSIRPGAVEKDDQVFGLDEAGDEGGERVVVAELDLGGAHGVVFVDDRDGAVADDLAEGLGGRRGNACARGGRHA